MLKKQAKGNQTQSVEEIFGLSREGSRILLLILTPLNSWRWLYAFNIAEFVEEL